MADAETLNLSNCDKEPIHIIGGVQPHGYFFAFRPNDKTIYHASMNADQLTGMSAKDSVGKTLEKVFGEDWAVKILKASARIEGEGFEFIHLQPKSGEGILEVLLYGLEGLVAVEFEPRTLNTDEESNALAYAHKRSLGFVEELHRTMSLSTASKLVCRAIRSMIGYDRVMMYRYLPTWDGEVIAEDKSPEAHSFMQHRFPASDIPLPARQLYLKNRTRQIVDSHATAVPIEPAIHYLTRKPIDLSHSKLRAVSPIHLAYLKNMRVRASFSVAVIVDGQLWGLIACHGPESMIIPQEVRLACETLASTFAVLASMMENLSERSQHLEFEERLRRFFQELRMSKNPADDLMRNHTKIEELFGATGIGMKFDGNVEIAGLTPPQNVTGEIADWLRERFETENKTVIAIDSLASANPEWAALKDLACGVLGVYSKENGGAVFMIFRPEFLRTVTWGGDPRKSMEKRKYEGPINPRVSFESWSETVTGHSARWLPYESQGAAYVRDFIFDSLIRKERLIADLGHQLQRSSHK